MILCRLIYLVKLLCLQKMFSLNQKQNQKSGENRSQLTFPIVGKKNNATKNNNKNTNNQNAITSNESMQNIPYSFASSTTQNSTDKSVRVNGTSSDVGNTAKDDSVKVSEIKIHETPSKSISSFNMGIVIFAIIVIIALLFGYKRYEKEE